MKRVSYRPKKRFRRTLRDGSPLGRRGLSLEEGDGKRDRSRERKRNGEREAEPYENRYKKQIRNPRGKPIKHYSTGEAATKDAPEQRRGVDDDLLNLEWDLWDGEWRNRSAEERAFNANVLNLPLLLRTYTGLLSKQRLVDDRTRLEKLVTWTMSWSQKAQSRNRLSFHWRGEPHPGKPSRYISLDQVPELESVIEPLVGALWQARNERMERTLGVCSGSGPSTVNTMKITLEYFEKSKDYFPFHVVRQPCILLCMGCGCRQVQVTDTTDNHTQRLVLRNGDALEVAPYERFQIDTPLSDGDDGWSTCIFLVIEFQRE